MVVENYSMIKVSGRDRFTEEVSFVRIRSLWQNTQIL